MGALPRPLEGVVFYVPPELKVHSRQKSASKASNNEPVHGRATGPTLPSDTHVAETAIGIPRAALPILVLEQEARDLCDFSAPWEYQHVT